MTRVKSCLWLHGRAEWCVLLLVIAFIAPSALVATPGGSRAYPVPAMHGTGYVRNPNVHILQRAVRDLTADEEYPQHEIDNRWNDKIKSAWECLGSALVIAGGFVTRSRLVVAGGAAGVMASGNQVLEAQKDITKMEKHNTKVRERKNRIKDQRFLERNQR